MVLCPEAGRRKLETMNETASQDIHRIVQWQWPTGKPLLFMYVII